MERFLTLMSVFVFAYIFISASALSVAVFAEDGTNETENATTTTVPEETTTTTTESTTTTTTTTTTTLPKQLSASITLEKETYYPTDSFEPRVTVTTQNNEIIIDAMVSGVLTYGDESTNLRFFYSTLCDCYKAWHYFSEGTLPNDYTLTVTASYVGYESVSDEKTFSVQKPGLNMDVSTDKTEYFLGDSVKLTIDITDDMGNAMTPDSISGDMRYADTGELVSVIYLRKISEGVYYYTYYFRSTEVDKSYTMSVTADWKEQEATGSATFSVAKRGLNADIALENDVLTPGDRLYGKVKVFDKYGNTMPDAWVSVEIKDSDGDMKKYLSTNYKDGFYEIESWKIDEWMQVGEYTLYAKVNKGDESIIIEKSLQILKENLNVEVIFDQSSYSPGGRVYIKVLVTYPDGTIAEDAYVGGEIFPLEVPADATTTTTTTVPEETTTTTTEEAIETTSGGTGESAIDAVTGAVVSVMNDPKVCRIYFHPEGPIYYKGEWLQKYYIDDSHIPDWCPTGTYVLRLTVSASGYADTTIEKEFDVALLKLLLETGFKIDSSSNNVNLYMYAEVKDDEGNVVPYVNIGGYLHPFEEVESTEGIGCVQRVSFGYDRFIERYSATAHLQKRICPAGEYLLEITASQSSYETAQVEQSVIINYSKDYEYSVVMPPVVGQNPAVCREVSCGPDCFQRVCSAPKPAEQCFEEVVDKECMMACKEKSVDAEESASKGTADEFELDECVNACESRVECRGSRVQQASDEEMMRKLDEIHEEVQQSNKGIQRIMDTLNNLIELLKRLLMSGGVISPAELGVARITSTPAPTITQQQAVAE